MSEHLYVFVSHDASLPSDLSVVFSTRLTSVLKPECTCLHSPNQTETDGVKMRSGYSSLIPALTRSPASVACPAQTCLTSMAVTNQTTKTRNTFDGVPELFMKLLFILSASSTRCPVILCNKACHMQPVSPSRFQKAHRSPSESVAHTF